MKQSIKNRKPIKKQQNEKGIKMDALAWEGFKILERRIGNNLKGCVSQ